MSDARLHKRPRQDENDGGGKDAGDAGRTRDGEFWFDDGSIILLIARNVEFRVYKGLLADHSPVFKDMFSLPQPPTATSAEAALETSCPVVHLSDSPEDVRCLLRVCMPKSNTNPYAHEDPTFESIASSIRLGHKYQIAPLVDHALGYLKEYYTDDYAKWKSRKMLPPPRFKPEHAIGVINLARLVECESILPTAIIHCCLLEAKLLDGLAHADGTTEHLSPSDLALCFSAGHRLVRQCIRIALLVRDPAVSPTCRNPAQCALLFADILNSPAVDTSIFFPNPFQSFGVLFTGLAGLICEDCYGMLCRRDTDERKALWGMLPAVMGLSVEGWPASSGNNAAA